MKIRYFRDIDTLHIEFRSTKVTETRDLAPGSKPVGEGVVIRLRMRRPRSRQQRPHGGLILHGRRRTEEQRPLRLEQ